MWREAKRFFFVLFAGLCLLFLAGVLQAEEPGRWYLISETELQSIEKYRETSGQEKANLLLLVRELRQASVSLNAQLAEAREKQRKSEQLFNEYEAEKLTQLSLKNGEIADLKQEVADQKQRVTKAKGTAAARLAVIIALTAVIVLYVGFKVCRKFRLIP